MITNCKFLLGAVVLTASLLFAATFYQTRNAFSASRSQENHSHDLPTLDYENEVTKAKSKERKEKGDHFKGGANPDTRKPIDELPEGVEPLPITGAWWRGLSALPTEQSDAVVLGVVTSRDAYLSQDRTGIYSEFTVLVSEVFKDPTKTIISGTPISVNRTGGAVRFKSGKIQKYQIAHQGMPDVAAPYVLFLRKTSGGDLLILTGFKLVNGHVTPLDGNENNDPRLVLPFAKYAGTDEAEFLKEVRDAAAGSAKAGAQ
ncbi:MAG: hypothetical protein V7638_2308 [Acidobacteriota bacterium]